MILKNSDEKNTIVTKSERFTITKNHENERLDFFLSENTGKSRSFIQKLIKDSLVKINSESTKSNRKLKENDIIDIIIPDIEERKILPEDIPLDIVYEDDDVLVINKARGMVVHPAPGHYSGTLVNALLFRYGNKLSDANGSERPGIVHRIDSDTSGILVCAKNNEAHMHLSAQLKEHSMKRIYNAIVYNSFKETSGIINKRIARGDVDRKRMVISDNGREAITHYRVLENIGDFAFIECILETGRTHQIRVHMKHIGHPLMGDPIYAKNTKSPFKTNGQMLHAKVLGFIHPKSGKYLEFDSNLPDDFLNALKLLRQIRQR